ncbi:hypothetical protein GIB67_029202 [Kingdonia uniflora]|uniref:Uncharacterized protein n=1 Tax=Kingdonia uniflora TaxID=39325 RepID=A0A7J7NAM7_9MAGN|nr:hypothetical protein GIB67_029202 [Kingdonia uniflora]
MGKHMPDIPITAFFSKKVPQTPSLNFIASTSNDTFPTSSIVASTLKEALLTLNVSVKLFVGGRGKIGFLLGTEKEPVQSYPKYAKWFSDDSMVYSQRENNVRIFQLSNEIWNFKQGTQNLGMYYARLRSSWEELSYYDSFIEWSASAPSEKVPIPPMAAEIYTKIVEKTWVFQFLAGLNPDFEYARVHLLDRTHFPTLEEAHAYCLFDQSCRSPMTPISGIPSETFTMAARYAYLAPPLVPLQTSHTSSPNLSPLPAAFSNSRPLRKKCDYCGKWGHLKTTCHALHGRPAGYQPRPSQSLTHLSAVSSTPNSSALVFSLRMKSTGCQPPILDCQASSIALGLPPAINSPLSGIEPSPTTFIPVTIDDDSFVSHSDDDRPIVIRKEKHNAGKPDKYSDTTVYFIVDYTSDHQDQSNISRSHQTVCTEAPDYKPLTPIEVNLDKWKGIGMPEESSSEAPDSKPLTPIEVKFDKWKGVGSPDESGSEEWVHVEPMGMGELRGRIPMSSSLYQPKGSALKCQKEVLLNGIAPLALL